MDIKLQQVTYQDIIEGKMVEGDDYHLYQHSFIDLRKEIFLKNPSLTDYSSVAAYLVKAGDIIVGHLFPFPTRMKVGDKIINATSASDLFVIEEYEKYAAGADLVMAPIRERRNDAVILADISAEGMGCYHAFRFIDFALPKMLHPHSSKFIYQNFGIKGILLKVLCVITDLFLKPLSSFNVFRLRRFAKKFEIVKLSEVPTWVDEMVLNDGHKYMEVHDHKWLQWCIDNCFSSDDSHKKNFYAIVNNNKKPIGFFLNAVRTATIPARNIKEMKQGTLMEWGSYDESKLSELDITKLAMASMPDDVSLSQFATSNPRVIKKMRKYGFFHHNYHHVVFKDCKKQFKDAKNPSQWRLRFGYADSLF